MAAKIQDADVKGTADVTADSRLINDNKIYVASLSKRLDQAVSAGDFATGKPSSQQIVNLGIATSVSANALTVAFKDNAGSDASSTSAIKIGFRSSTLTTGSFVERTLSSASSLTVPSGATLGTISGVAAVLYIYAIDNAGTIEPAISNDLYTEQGTVSTTALSAGSSSAAIMYSTTARTSVAFRLVGRIDITETTAGTWATNATRLSVGDYGNLQQNLTPTIQKFTSGSGTYTTPAKAQYIRVRLVGAGGGGGASGTTGSPTSGGTGGNTTFGSSLLSGTGGAGGSVGTGGAGGFGGAGGTGSLGSGPVGTTMSGAQGGSSNVINGSQGQPGGQGGGTSFSGGGGGGGGGGTGATGPINSGAGGGGAGGPTGSAGGGGGGGGGFVDAIITSPSATYAYSVGTAGTAGSIGGGNGGAGGAGAAGYIEVTEYYR